ncbi:MAG: tetratricopeptide repeat protein [candidate division Zixibacteria bacterium]|nr:tetratricopeptide repeat protein [candidate division Zixibacteria bacterium]
MNNGQTELAIQCYEKSLELNPENTNAVAMLRQLRSGQ